MVNPVPLAPGAKFGKIARWWCRVPRCGAAQDGTIVDWRKHYIEEHMQDSYGRRT